MPLLKGKDEIGHNVSEMEKTGHPHDQAVAAALRTAGVKKNAEPAANRLRLRGVEIFPSGVHRGKEWSERGIDQAIANFDRYSTGPKPVHAVADRIGHGESDQPASGWYRRLYKEVQPCGLCKGAGGNCPRCQGTGKQAMLKGDVEDVSPQAAEKFASGEFPYSSAEFYPSPAFLGLAGEGPMLRRVAALGGEPPEVKGMAPRPPVEKYGERRVRELVTFIQETPLGTIECFSERPMAVQKFASAAGNRGMSAQVDDAGKGHRTKDGEYKDMESEWHISMGEDKAMDPEQMKAKLVQAGADPAAVEAAAANPAVLAMCCQLADGPKDPDEEMDTADPAAMAPEKKMEYGERCRKMSEKWGERMKKFGEMPQISTVGGMKKPEEERTVDAEKYAEARAKLAAIYSFAETNYPRVKETKINAALERLCGGDARGAKVVPALKDSLRASLMAMNDLRVEKFNEGGRIVEKTPLDKAIADLEKLPYVVKFGEGHLPGRKPHVPPAIKAAALKIEPDDEESLRVVETVEKFSEKFDNLGMNAETILAGFRSERKHGDNPRLTADEYLEGLVR